MTVIPDVMFGEPSAAVCTSMYVRVCVTLGEDWRGERIERLSAERQALRLRQRQQ